MDLTLFIVSIIFMFMIYYLVSSIQSLIQEMREVKNKCIKTQNAKVEDFKVDTENPTDAMKRKASEFISSFIS